MVTDAIVKITSYFCSGTVPWSWTWVVSCLDTVMWHTYVNKFMQSLCDGFCTEKMIRIFLVLIPIELVSFKSASGVEFENPVNAVQPLGHFCRRTVWKSRMAEKPGKQGAYVLHRCIQPSAPCRNVGHRAGFTLL